MPLPTGNDVQAVNEVLSNMLVGYMQSDDRFVADKVFPGVSVDKDSGTYYIATKKYWFLDEMDYRAYGDHFARAGYTYSTTTYTTLQWSLEHPIPDETRANSQVPLGLEEIGVRWLGQQALIRKERQFSTDFMTTGVWGTDDNNSTTDWDDFSAGDPVADVLTAVRTISNNTGYKPNTMVCGFIVYNALINHPDIIDRVKYTRVAGVEEMRRILGNALGLENVFNAPASYNSANEGQDFSASAIIDDDALICHVAPQVDMFSASAGKTFYWSPGGGLGTISSYREEETKSDILRCMTQWDQKATATDLGYFFADVV